jgi:hypothetical protein
LMTWEEEITNAAHTLNLHKFILHNISSHISSSKWIFIWIPLC